MFSFNLCHQSGTSNTESAQSGSFENHIGALVFCFGMFLAVYSAEGTAQETVPQPASETTNPYESLAPKDLDKFCEKVKSNDVYIKYSRIVAKSVKLGYTKTAIHGNDAISSWDFSPPSFDGDEQLIKNWYEKNPYVRVSGSYVSFFRTSERISGGMNVYGLDDDLNHRSVTGRSDYLNNSHSISADEDYVFRIQTHRNLLGALKSCFDEIVTTDLAYVFVSPISVKYLRKDFYEAKMNPQVKVREVTPLGDVVEKTVQNPAMERYVRARDSELKMSGAHWLTLVYGADKVLNISGEEHLKYLQARLERDKPKLVLKK